MVITSQITFFVQIDHLETDLDGMHVDNWKPAVTVLAVETGSVEKDLGIYVHKRLEAPSQIDEIVLTKIMEF